MANKKESAHMDGVAGMGCIQCIFIGFEDTPAEIHHCGTGGGGGRDHMRVAGLCPTHHRWKLAIDKQGKERRHIEAKLLAYVAEHCPCQSCKDTRNGVSDQIPG